MIYHFNCPLSKCGEGASSPNEEELWVWIDQHKDIHERVIKLSAQAALAGKSLEF
jgi:hypothetical protein